MTMCSMARDYMRNTRKESNKGKQCIKVPFPRVCTPEICGIMSCGHAEGIESTIKHSFRREEK